MIGGKLENGDVLVEVEDKHTYNVAPPVYPGQQLIGQMSTGLMSNEGAFTVTYSGDWVMMRPNWATSGPDAFGNRQYDLDNVAFPRKVWAIEKGSENAGVAGKYYAMTVQVKTMVISMPGHPDAIPNQPNCRINLYATNGNEAQDLLIAQSSPINPTQASNASFPFHPGFREWTVDVLPVQPMPVGKTYFRMEVEYDSAWTADKTIWLPYEFSPSQIPQQLRLFDLNKNTANIYEYTVGGQTWDSVSGTPTYYWEYQTITSSTSGIDATFTIPDDSLIKTEGGVFTFATNHNGSFSVTITGGSTSYNSGTLTGTGTATWFSLDNIPSTAFDGANITLTVNTRYVAWPSLYANINHTDTDGFNYYTYTDLAPHVAHIDVNRYDTEVSTAVITLRENDSVDLDTGNFFDVGKRVRIRANVLSGQYAGNWYGQSNYAKGTVFVGKVQNRRATYPRGVRPEVKVLVVNDYPLLQEKTTACLKTLDAYKNVLPYVGIPVATDGSTRPPQSVNPNTSYTGFADFEGDWELKDEENGFSLIDAVMVTRDSTFGYVWFNRFGVLNLKSTIPTDTITFTDATPGVGEYSYSSVDLNFDTANVINYLRLDELQWVETIAENLERIDSVKKTETSVFNQESVNKYRKAEHKMQVFKRTDYSEYTSKILDKYSEPVVTASTLTLPVRTTAELEMAVQLEVYQNISVVYTGRLDATYRVNSIKHVIVPGEVWKTTLGFGVNLDGVLWD